VVESQEVERVELATDVALGLVTVTPSITQAAALVGAPLYRVEARIKQAEVEAAARVALIEEAEEMDRQIDAATTAVDNIVVDVESFAKPRITKRAFKLHERVKNGIVMAYSAIEYCDAFDETVTLPSGHPLFNEFDRQIIQVLRDRIEAERAYWAALEAEIGCTDEEAAD
jgi:hypothetical protein